jgi:two-component system response regulator HydG
VRPHARRDRPANRTDLHLAELLDFRPDQGVIRLHEQRVVILSAAAMGLLRKQLVDTLGVETTRRLLLRFGFADGYHDAVNLRQRSDWSTPLDGLRAGATLHTLEGLVRAEVRRVDYDPDTGGFNGELAWHDSYEAEQHLHHYGRSAAPVCWSLVGYSSGFATACLGREIYFREQRCLGEGASHCTAIGRDAESWGAGIDAIRADFQAGNVGHEMERLRQAVGRRLKELDRRERLLERRERELNLLRERVNRHAAAKHFVVRSQAMQDVL